MTTVATVQKDTAFQLKGSLFTLTVLQMVDSSQASFKTQLTRLVQQMPKFFEHAPVIIDLAKVKHLTDIDFSFINATLRAQTIIPVGVRGGSESQHTQALTAGLAILPDAKEDESNGEKAKTKPPVKHESQATKIVRQQVRSGQQIYAKGGDLIVLGAVSHGAELLADGNITVYGPLRGRALAGVCGNSDAHIFCHSLEAELISIAGFYRLNEEDAELDACRNVHIYLEDERLHLETLP